MTDFLDGYLARRYGLETAIGRVLDPIADKFLVCSCLITLLAVCRIYFIWVILLIGREMAMLSLRHFAALHNISVPVSYLGKIKSCLQMFLLMVLIADSSACNSLWFGCSWLTLVLLFLTVFTSLLSLYRYIIRFLESYRVIIPK